MDDPGLLPHQPFTLAAPHRSTHPLSYPVAFVPPPPRVVSDPPPKQSPLGSMGPGWDTATVPGTTRAVGTAWTVLLPGRVGAASGLD